MMLYSQRFDLFLCLIGQNENKQSNHKEMIKYGILGLVTD
jgi:hypothetical protein